MKLKMAKNSIFAILLRSAWWISAAIAVAIVVAARGLLPPQYFGVGAFGAFPFVIIAGMAFWKQCQTPSAARVEHTVAAVRGLSWPAFAQTLAHGFEQDGCEVERPGVPGQPDLLLRKKGKLAVVAARRWKASRVGVEPLRELAAAGQAHGAAERIYVTIGDVGEQAVRYAKEQDIQFLGPDQLARLLPALGRKA